MSGPTYTITCSCGNVHTVTCPGGGTSGPPPIQPTPFPQPRVPLGPLAGYRVSLMDALPADVFTRGGTDPVVVHLDASTLFQTASAAGRHVIVSHGATVMQAHG